jgi:hypothetical protein
MDLADRSPCVVGLGASRIPVSGSFGGGHREGMVGEVGDELQVAAECLDVAGDSLDGGQLAALDLGDPAWGDAHGLGELGLGEAALLALLGEPLPALPGHQGFAASFGFFGPADALDVGVAVPLGVAGHWLPSSAVRSFR